MMVEMELESNAKSKPTLNESRKVQVLQRAQIEKEKCSGKSQTYVWSVRAFRVGIEHFKL
jgi:hypothetical protein